MMLFMTLMVSAAFLGMFQKTRDGVLCGLALVLLLFTLSAIFPDSVLAAALHALFPFTLRP
jgi:hypothetical protein